jgi:diguanylate cyclase (GGDEF)-like protein/putative nucleotidyltransferase with HDIG domain
MPTTHAGLRTSADLQAARGLRTRRDLLDDRVLRWAAAAAVAWMATYALITGLAGSTDGGLLALSVMYVCPIVAAVLLSSWAAWRARGRTRWFWALLGVSNWFWLAGELTWMSYELRGAEAPFPSLADVFYLSCYVLVVPAVVCGFGAGWLRVSRSLLDASVIAASLGLLGWQLVIEPQLAFGASLATGVGIAYPLLGVATIVVVGVLSYGSHRHVPLSVGVVAVALLSRALTDVAFTWAVVVKEYVPGGWLDLGWQLEAVLLALAGAAAVRHAEIPTPAGLRRDGALPLLLAGALVTTVVTVLDARNGNVSLATGLLALFTLGAVAARLVLTVHEKELAARRLQESLGEQERLAITDGLTGLHNRRFLEEVLRIEAERCMRAGRPLSIVVLDADHFKRVNDTFGHPVGDVVLREISQRLLACARPSDVVARYGGEEFVVLLPEVDSEGAMEIAERCRQAIRSTPVHVDGQVVSMSVSLGVVTLPEHAQDVQSLLRIADQSLYLAKDLGRDRVQVGAAGGPEAADPVPASEAVSFLCTLADRVDALQSPFPHTATVGRWAAALAERLGLDSQTQLDCYWAGRLHDIGKIQVPDDVLRKPGPLDEDEWQLVRRHTVAGAELLRLLPDTDRIAAIVEQHHERVDGRGYPAGLIRSDIRIEARIVAVCDAFAAMVSPRCYQPQRSAEDAAAVLLADAGTRWDPQVVDCFLALLRSKGGARLGLAALASQVQS